MNALKKALKSLKNKKKTKSFKLLKLLNNEDIKEIRYIPFKGYIVETYFGSKSSPLSRDEVIDRYQA